jgi:hypothetical protein
MTLGSSPYQIEPHPHPFSEGISREPVYTSTRAVVRELGTDALSGNWSEDAYGDNQTRGLNGHSEGTFDALLA